VSPGFSRQLEADVLAAGGQYVEAPVSGSRIPAEQGLLVGMLAGHQTSVEAVAPLLAPVCKSTFRCGVVPGALTMKLAVNLFLITMVAGLAEAANFAQRQGLDLAVFRSIIESGPMHSRVAGMKLPMLVDKDFPVQASIKDVLMNARLVASAAHEAAIAAPLIDDCVSLFAQTVELGHGAQDMAAVVLALAERSAGKATAP
jgi:3-hydroxyisobutyrate dehydrogenase